MSNSIRNRRQFLSIAAGILAAPFVSLGNSNAQTAGKPPVRFLTIVDSYGFSPAQRNRSWVESSVDDYALGAGSLGTILAPLEAHRDKLIVMSNISNESSKQTKDGITHDKLMAQTLTGSMTVNGGKGASAQQHHASLDYRIGTYLKEGYGLKRVYPHLFLSDYAEGGKTSPCFDENGNQIRAISGAENIVKSLFGSIDPTANAGAEEALTLDSESQAIAFGLVQERLAKMRGELINANASVVLDAYESGVQDLATELELRGSISCTAPSAAGAVNAKSTSSPPRIFDAIHQAFACDLASSITYAIGGENINQISHPDLFDAGNHDAAVKGDLTRNHHAVSHKSGTAADTAQEIVRTWQAGLVAGLVEKLSTTADTDGSTLMDNTVIFLTSAMSNNTHNRENYALAALAGKNTNLKGGFHYDCKGSTNNELLTTLAQGVMLPETEFGGFDRSGKRIGTLNRGPISRMLKEVLS